MVAQASRFASGPFVPYRIPQAWHTRLLNIVISFRMSSSWGGLFGRPAIFIDPGRFLLLAVISRLAHTPAPIDLREFCARREENYLAVFPIAMIVAVLLEAILR